MLYHGFLVLRFLVLFDRYLQPLFPLPVSIPGLLRGLLRKTKTLGVWAGEVDMPGVAGREAIHYTF